MVVGTVHPGRPTGNGAAVHPSLVAELERLGLDPGAPPDAAGWEALLQALSRGMGPGPSDRRRFSSVDGSLASVLDRHEGDPTALFHAGTAVPNGLAFRAALRGALSSGLGNAEVAVLLIGLDGLARVGKRLGERGAEEAVEQAADRVKAVLRQVDLVAYLDDDLFGVLLPDVPSDVPVKRISHRIETAFAEPLVAAGHYVYFGAAVGAALGRSGSSPDDVVRRGRLSLDWHRSSKAHPANGSHAPRLALSA